jgi:hypothetical protein
MLQSDISAEPGGPVNWWLPCWWASERNESRSGVPISCSCSDAWSDSPASHPHVVRRLLHHGSARPPWPPGRWRACRARPSSAAPPRRPAGPGSAGNHRGRRTRHPLPPPDRYFLPATAVGIGALDHRRAVGDPGRVVVGPRADGY